MRKNALITILWLVSSFSFLYAQVREEWVARYFSREDSYNNARAVALDAKGNIYVTGSSDGEGYRSEFATIKYDPQGNQIWVARYRGPGGGDFGSGIALDAQGNVYVTGSSFGIDTSYDYATVKFDPNGNQLWAARYNGPGNFEDVPTDIAVDAAGNVYVTGYSWGIGTNADYATIKYDTNGNELWVARYDGTKHDLDRPHGLALDAAGNVYVTGMSNNVGTGFDFATIKYDNDGNQLWVAIYNDHDFSSDEGNGIAVDPAGNIYVTGSSVDNFGSEYVTVKYDSDGKELWVAKYRGPGRFHRAQRIKLDDQGGVYVTGTSDGMGTFTDYATIKYDTEGNELWVARYDGPAHGYDTVSAMRLDADGNVYVTGVSAGKNSRDYATIKYDAKGKQMWVARFEGPVSFTTVPSMAIDDDANVYVAGSLGEFDGREYVTIKYAQ